MSITKINGKEELNKKIKKVLYKHIEPGITYNDKVLREKIKKEIVELCNTNKNIKPILNVICDDRNNNADTIKNNELVVWFTFREDTMLPNVMTYYMEEY